MMGTAENQSRQVEMTGSDTTAFIQAFYLNPSVHIIVEPVHSSITGDSKSSL